MTEQSLGAGSTTRRRALFGLFATDGWTWASLKALFWFILIILLLAYLPDRAYYFTVFSTIDLGINAISPVNLCPPENRGLPCPAPVGAALPWDPSPPELSLPAGRYDGAVVQSGTKFLYIGGTDGQHASDQVFVAHAFAPGAFSRWSIGPALPAPRDKEAAVFLGGSTYVFGGLDESGKPTTSAYVLTPDSTTGALGTWQTSTESKLPIDLPEARAGSSIVAAADGLILVGGVGPDGKPTTTVWKSTLDSNGKLQAWQPTTALPAPRTDATAVFNGEYLYVYGGSDASGPTAVVLRGTVAAAPAPVSSTGTTGVAGPSLVTAWGTGTGGTNLPAPRTDAAGFSANGALYLVGGTDGKTLAGELYWAVPDSNGNIGQWLHLPQSDLPSSGLVGGRAIVNGADAFIIGGQTKGGVVAGAVRADLAPQPPFFQLGLVGATIPALQIGGDVGQQLGYLAAATVGGGNFILLLLVGWAFAHPDKVRAMREKLRARRHGG
ncbi:MAG TPA: kelch repeat-containing protein [Candidatus Saccharimonadales bacterium]|nr:kelch repeat-containing protein [Candidatus Saccharimonadales bacterium]HVB38827.1 kelch repeat-containing protein [Vicinamibacterales bacterium]